MTTREGGGRRTSVWNRKRIDVFWIASRAWKSKLFASYNRRLCKRSFSKSIKLAAEQDRRLLIPLSPDPEDSGIDSDTPGNLEARLLQRGMQLSDPSSSDEEPADKPWWRRPSRKNNDQMNVVVGEPQPLNMRQWPPSRSPPEQSGMENSPDRSSPPLFEVELTASDEDDDASVLELVIPLQSSRYQRLPTSSPKKMRTKTIRLICSFLCCVRK